MFGTQSRQPSQWGLDEALKRIPRARLEAEIRMHQLANLNLIRNWVGQSTGEDFYELCDKYGILLWDEFFQPNPSDGPDPADLDTYIANVREKILRFRNHPSIAVWCARNEGFPPKDIEEALRKVMAELEPKVANLADFVRKAQLMNYESYRAMYEGSNAQMFHPTTTIITWMSNPA